MPESDVEFELKLLVPRAARAAVRVALAERGAALGRRHLVARYFDTSDRRLARAGLSLRLRREGRRWVQTLKAGGEIALARFEHEVPRPDPTIDVAAHAGTSAGDRLAGLLADGAPLQQRYGTDMRRTLRRLRTRGAVVELAFDQGRIDADDRTLRVCELEFELISGSPAALLALAERWRARLGLVVDARSKAERGDALADGRAPAGGRRALPVTLRRKVEVAEAWRTVLDECIAQVLSNAIGLTVPLGVEAGAASVVDRADLVHQLRIALRRLRSAVRLFRGWVEPVPEAIGAGARELFRALGALRDRDVLAQAIEPALQRAGAPARRDAGAATVPAAATASPKNLHNSASGRADEACLLIAAESTQRWLLALLGWRSALGPGADAASIAAGCASEPLAALARRRLTRWQRALTDQASRFAQLDEASLHALRKRAKRLRYASEFVESLFPRKEMRRFTERLRAVQQALGELGDLALAARRYGREDGVDSRDWFVRGWLSARREALATQAAAAFVALAERHPFGGKR